MNTAAAPRVRSSLASPVWRHCEQGHERVSWRDTTAQPLRCWYCGKVPQRPSMQSKTRGRPAR